MVNACLMMTYLGVSRLIACDLISPRSSVVFSSELLHGSLGVNVKSLNDCTGLAWISPLNDEARLSFC